MPKQARLVLEDGSVYPGEAFGAIEKSAYGEVVFNTSMTGYQEVLTDPSYAGQIVVPTYPLIGNYGVNERDFESKRVQVSGFVVRQHCVQPSHSLSTATVDGFLASQGVPGISGVDTRAITRRLRTHGVMMGIIAVDESPEKALSRLRDLPRYGDVDFVKQVSAEAPYDWNAPVASPPNPTASHNEPPGPSSPTASLNEDLLRRGVSTNGVAPTSENLFARLRTIQRLQTSGILERQHYGPYMMARKRAYRLKKSLLRKLRGS